MHPRSTRSAVSELIDHLSEIGQRRPTSSQEAAAAAYFNGRLRSVGLKVATDRLSAARRSSLTSPLLMGAAAGAALLSLQAPWLSCAALLLIWVLLLIDGLIAPLPVLAPRGESQNIVGTREIGESGGLRPRAPRWRVVMLAPLDSSNAPRGLRRLAGSDRSATMGRITAVYVAAVIAALAALLPTQPWASAQIGPTIYLLLIALGGMLPVTPSHTDGGAYALAATFDAARQLSGLRHTEVWAVGLGATSSDNSGLRDLLSRYPFPAEHTLFVVVAPLHGNTLAFATREGAVRPRAADRLLLRLVGEVDAADPAIDADPRPLQIDQSSGLLLLRQQRRALSLFSPTAPADPRVVERSSRLLIGLVQRLEALEVARESAP